MHTIALNTAGNNKIGTCPHGLPQGACPICSGMGGGAKKADFSAKPGEMSWNECAAIGAFLRAQRNAQAQRQADAQNFAHNMHMFQASLLNASQRIANIAGFFAKNAPSVIAKPIGFILNTLVASPLKMIANLPSVVSNTLQTLGQKMADISDKLTAIMGELKNSIEKKISDKFNEFKKKVKSLFSIFKPLDIDNDDKKINKAKRTFELKTFIHKLYKKINEKEMKYAD